MNHWNAHCDKNWQQPAQTDRTFNATVCWWQVWKLAWRFLLLFDWIRGRRILVCRRICRRLRAFGRWCRCCSVGFNWRFFQRWFSRRTQLLGWCLYSWCFHFQFWLNYQNNSDEGRWTQQEYCSKTWTQQSVPFLKVTEQTKFKMW